MKGTMFDAVKGSSVRGPARARAWEGIMAGKLP